MSASCVAKLPCWYQDFNKAPVWDLFGKVTCQNKTCIFGWVGWEIRHFVVAVQFIATRIHASQGKLARHQNFYMLLLHRNDNITDGTYSSWMTITLGFLTPRLHTNVKLFYQIFATRWKLKNARSSSDLKRATSTLLRRLVEWGWQRGDDVLGALWVWLTRWLSNPSAYGRDFWRFLRSRPTVSPHASGQLLV